MMRGEGKGEGKGNEGEVKKLEIPPEEWKQLSHKERRSHVNRTRRKHRRTIAAQQKEAERKALESQPEYLEKMCREERKLAEALKREEAKSMLENAAWFERERLAQEEFRNKREVEDRKRKEREERERLIREEWEALKQKEKEENEVKEREKKEKEERLKEALSVGQKLPVTGSEPWHNPIAPEDYDSNEATPRNHAPSQDYGTEKDQQHCSFFLKTGACRFKDRCSRKHPRLTSSCTLLVPAMYSSLGLREQALNERDQDVALEYDEKEAYEDFRNFFNDALPEFSKAGKVVQFKVSCNHEIHLRGNVYVQYSTEEACAKAFQMFNGRWYAQKQLSCEFCPVTKWKSAICGLFNHRRCPKGRHCNFLHVFPNPTGAFYRADRDLPPLSPPPPHSSSHLVHSSPYYDRGNNSRRHFRSRNGRVSRYSRSRSLSSGRKRQRRSRSISRSPYGNNKRHRRSRSHSRSKSRSRSPHSNKKRRRRSKSHTKSRSRSRSPYDNKKRRRKSRSMERSRQHRKRRSRSRSRSDSRESWSCGRHRPRSRISSSCSLSRSRSRSASSDRARRTRERHHSHRKKKKKRSRDSSHSRHSKRHHHKSKKKHHHHIHHELRGDLSEEDRNGQEVEFQDDAIREVQVQNVCEGELEFQGKDEDKCNKEIDIQEKAVGDIQDEVVSVPLEEVEPLELKPI